MALFIQAVQVHQAQGQLLAQAVVEQVLQEMAQTLQALTAVRVDLVGAGADLQVSQVYQPQAVMALFIFIIRSKNYECKYICKFFI
jgi:hypothetical protein